MKTIILAMVILAASCGAVPAADLGLADDFPVVGRGQNVIVSGVERAGDLRLWVIYSPNSETQVEEEIGRFSVDGEIGWIPSRFGIATLSARDGDGGAVASENVAILFATTPVTGVLVMLFAGVLLFGGAGFSLRSVLSSGVPKQLPPIDT